MRGSSRGGGGRILDIEVSTVGVIVRGELCRDVRDGWVRDDGSKNAPHLIRIILARCGWRPVLIRTVACIVRVVGGVGGCGIERRIWRGLGLPQWIRMTGGLWRLWHDVLNVSGLWGDAARIMPWGRVCGRGVRKGVCNVSWRRCEGGMLYLCLGL